MFRFFLIFLLCLSPIISNAENWKPVPSASPGFMMDADSIKPYAYPQSYPSGYTINFAHGLWDSMDPYRGHPLVTYFQVNIRRQAAVTGFTTRSELWAMDCHGHYAPISWMNYDTSGKPRGGGSVAYETNSLEGPDGVYSNWGPEHFLTLETSDLDSRSAEAIVCTQERTDQSLPIRVTSLSDQWFPSTPLPFDHDRAVGIATNIVGPIGGDSGGIRLILFAKMEDHFHLQIGFETEFTRRLNFYRYKDAIWPGQNADIELRGPGFSSKQNFDVDLVENDYKRQIALTRKVDQALQDMFFKGGYDIIVSEKGVAPIIFHVEGGVPPDIQQKFLNDVDVMIGKVPSRHFPSFARDISYTVNPTGRGVGILCTQGADCTELWQWAQNWVHERKRWSIRNSTPSSVVADDIADIPGASFSITFGPQSAAQYNILRTGNMQVTFVPDCAGQEICDANIDGLESEFAYFVTHGESQAQTSFRETNYKAFGGPLLRITDDSQYPVVVDQAGSPPIKANAQPEDRIISFDGENIKSISQLQVLWVKHIAIHSAAELKVERSGQPVTLEVKF